MFSTTFPVKPSVTKTSTFEFAKSLPSTFPIKFNCDDLRSLNVDFYNSLPFELSSPLLISPILGFSISNKSSDNFEPMIAN